jgi:hypothetical protein
MVAVAGVATFTNLSLNAQVGAFTLAFNSDGLASVSSSTFTLVVGAASALRVRTQPGGAIVGQFLDIQPVIEIVDAGGNFVSEQGVVVTASLASGNGSIVGPSATSVDGVATFNSLSMFGSVGSYTATFTASGLVSATSSAFQLKAGAPTRLSLLNQPTTAQSGVPLSPQPFLAAVDASGNLASNYNGIMTATVSAGIGSLSFASANLESGASTFQSLTLSGPPGPVGLSFHSGSLEPVSSTAITLAIGPAARLVITTFPPSTVSDGVPMVPQPVVEVQDAGGNRVASSVTITLTTSATSGTITSATATAVNGVATFSGLTLSGPVGSRDYQFTAPGLPSTSIVRITIQ